MEQLEKLKSSGKLDDNFKIDALDGSPDIYVLRPTHTNSGSGLFDLSYGGTCVNHSSSGCSLSFNDRPTMCKSLVAAEGGIGCKGLSKYEIAEHWKGHQHYFENI